MNHEVEGEPWGLLCAAIRKRLRGGGAWIDDVVQDAVATLIEARQKGVTLRDDVGFCVRVAQRRLVDRKRRLHREVAGLNLDETSIAPWEPTKWAEKIRAFGVILSDEAAELLDRMESGFRGSRRLAECLGRDVKSIRERRWRLQKVLREMYVDFYGRPPLLIDHEIGPIFVLNPTRYSHMKSILLSLVMLLIAGRALSQVDPCYCMLSVSWDAAQQRWETDECEGNCFGSEGACKGVATWFNGDAYFECKCSKSPANCICSGMVRNPQYDPNQQAPLILCRTETPCALYGRICNPSHLLNYWGWGVSVPICICNDV